MRDGHRMNPSTISISYKELRNINAEAARRAVLEYLKSNGHNISRTAEVFGINRPVIYDILKKNQEGNLKDRSKRPHVQPHKTPAEVEDKVIVAKGKTRFGPERLSRYLKQYEKISVSAGTIRHIVRRNRDRIKLHIAHRVRKEKREFIDRYSAKPFEIVQIDLKHIRDHKALTREQIIHLDKYGIPNYQWSALDVNSRFNGSSPGCGRMALMPTSSSLLITERSLEANPGSR